MNEFKVFSFVRADASDFTSGDPNLRYKFAMETITLSINYSKVNNLILREMQVDLYKGVLFSKKKSKFTNFYLRNEEHVVSTKDSKKILDLSIKLDLNSEIFITKKYGSVMDLLSFVGGLYNGIRIIFLLMVYPIREILYYKTLINGTFNVCLEEEQIMIGLELMMNQDDFPKLEMAVEGMLVESEQGAKR
jgi:hypothetical protein